MNLIFRESRSLEKPAIVDTTSSKSVVYLRKNIKEVQVTSPMNEEDKTTMYTYMEAKLTKEEYEDYKLELQMQNSIDLDTCTLDELKVYWKQKINEQCTQTIAAGFDAETTQGTEHFSLTTTDQINIAGILITLQEGATSHPYHADGKLCREFTAEELIKISTAATQYKVYNTTLCNHIHVWIDRCETKEEITSISFTSTLPDDLAKSLQSVMASAQSASTATSNNTTKTE